MNTCTQCSQIPSDGIFFIQLHTCVWWDRFCQVRTIMSCWELDVLLVLQSRQSLVVTGTRKLPLPAGGWLIGQSGRGKCPSQWAGKDSRPRILSLSSKNFAFCWTNPYCWHQRTTADVGMSSPGNASVKLDGCEWSRFIKWCLLLWRCFFFFHTHPKLPKCKVLASECVSANSNREEAAEQILDVHCTVWWIGKIMSVHISYPFSGLSLSDLAKCVVLPLK